MCKLNWWNGVLDRHAICEFAYSMTMDRKFAFTMKQWHNIILTTLIQKPFVILFKHKPAPHEYSADQYLPYDKWDKCLHYYEVFLSTHKIPYLPYDYSWRQEGTIRLFLDMAADYSNTVEWWLPMWKGGYGCIGSPNPKVLLVAERMGPNNTHIIPFETGPTGQMLTDLLTRTGTPLGLFTVTNFIKSFRGDTRDVNDCDFKLLGSELDHLKPQHVVFMGSIAKLGWKEAKDRGIPYTFVPHFGAYSHRGIKSVEDYIPKWRNLMGIIPVKEL